MPKRKATLTTLKRNSNTGVDKSGLSRRSHKAIIAGSNPAPGTDSKKATRRTPKLVREYLRKIASRPRRTKGTSHARRIARNAAFARWQKEHQAPKPA